MSKTYTSLAEADQWFAERQHSGWQDHPSENRTAVLLRASEWIDRRFRFDGYPEDPGQQRAWPRMNAFYDDGRAATGIPAAIKEAVYLLADALLEDDQAGEIALGTGQQVISQKAAGMEIRYDHGQAGQTQIQLLLAPLLKRPDATQPLRRS